MKNQNGFSLTDLLAGMAMASILILLIGATLTTVNRHFFETRERLAAEEAASRAEMLLRLIFSQAINVQYTYTPGAWNLGTNPGQIMDSGTNGAFTFAKIADTVSTWTILAAFNRETSQGINTLNYGHLAGTALYYRRPEATGTCGMIFIADGHRATLDPSYSDQYIDRISYLSFTKHPHDMSLTPAIDKTASIDIHLRIRYHYIANGKTTWCPQDDMPPVGAVTPGCDKTAPWNDIDRQFNVLLRNNLLHGDTVGTYGNDAAVKSEERELGNLYFFQPVMPVK